MSDIYEHTSLTPLRVARESGYIDWASRPAIFKQYPEFLYRISFSDHEALKVIELSRKITAQTKRGDRSYYQLNTPSAGNLHPVELYVQIRALKGIISGIYHVDALNNSLVLIREIEKEGIEPSVGLSEKFNGIIFIVSSVPYRSEWKYRDRAFRYCFLDAGHQIGAINAAANFCGQSVTILSEFDANSLNIQMGFLNQEFCCGVLAIGSTRIMAVERIKSPLMQVAPTDYCESNDYITTEILEQGVYSAIVDEINSTVDEKAILQRRSARYFSQNKMPKSRFEHFMQLSTKMSKSLYSVVLQSDFIEAGVYKNGKLIKVGHFSKEITELLVNQNFVSNASMVVVITSEQFNSNELMNAAASAHRTQLEAQMDGVGFSGIGAFYDEKLQKFLQTKEYILYVYAIGSNS
ncbi:MAG: nitroreductase family protein [Sulfurimonas sp.]|jgi:SagB-type dehydrogenase family enzyme